MANSKKSKWKDRAKAGLFVLFGLVFWGVIASGAKVIITCAPAGCSMADLRDWMGYRDVPVMVVSLVAALWVSSRMFLDPSSDNES